MTKVVEGSLVWNGTSTNGEVKLSCICVEGESVSYHHFTYYKSSGIDTNTPRTPRGYVSVVTLSDDNQFISHSVKQK